MWEPRPRTLKVGPETHGRNTQDIYSQRDSRGPRKGPGIYQSVKKICPNRRSELQTKLKSIRNRIYKQIISKLFEITVLNHYSTHIKIQNLRLSNYIIPFLAT